MTGRRGLGALLLVALLSGCAPVGDTASDTVTDPGTDAVTGSVSDASLEELHEDLSAFWDEGLAGGVLEPELVVVDGDVDTACGAAGEDEGSFFCGADSTVYLQQVDLEDQQGPTWPVYLLAHEYAHAVQDQLGVDDGDAGRGPDGASVRYELQADCLAGAYVATRGDAVDLAPYRQVVGDSGDDVGDEPLPEREYEHGSAAQRTAAFERGVTGGPAACGLADEDLVEAG